MRRFFLFFAIVCFIGLKMVAEYNRQAHSPGRKKLIFPESVIVNKDLKDFNDSTLAPMLRTMKFKNSTDVLWMDIKPQSNENYSVKIIILCGGYHSDKRTNSGISTFCLVDTFFMKIEAPTGCPLIKVKDSTLVLNHLEDTGDLCDYPVWNFHTDGDSLVFEYVDFVFPDAVYEGKVMNFQTGRLKPKKTPTKSFIDPNVKMFSYHESIILNNNLYNFIKDNIIPILREQNFIYSRGILTMNIRKSNDAYNVELTIGESGCLANGVSQKGYLESLSIVDNYPIKIEAPVNCPFIQIKENSLNMKHQESKPKTETEKKWLFNLDGDSMNLVKTQ